MSPLAALEQRELSEHSHSPRHSPSRKPLSRPAECRRVPVPNSHDDHSGCQGHVHRSSRSMVRVTLSRFAARAALLGGTALAALLVALPVTPALVIVLAGGWLALGAPATLWYSISAAMVSTRDGRALISIGLTVLTDIVMALVLNTTLPAIGLRHPLAKFPLIVGMLVVVAALVATAPVSRPRIGSGTRVPAGLRPVLLTGAAAVTLAVAGAIRLNNGFSGAVGVVALLAVAALLILVFRRRERHSSAVTGIGLFLAATAVLLLNSLRGWFVTGHDIQLEYEIFQLANIMDRWDISAFREPYNACLSINLLPVLLSRLTGIPGEYVFKAVLPLFFALTPVLVYRSVRNVASQAIALLSAMYFMAFPTFFTDMTFMARQEVAFLLLGCVMVVVTDAARPLLARRAIVLVLLLGIVLSHYSTTYLVLVTFGLALAIDYGGRLVRRARHRPPATTTGFITWWMVALVAAGAVAWTGPATDTGGQVRITLATTVSNLLGKSSATGSSDTRYSLFGGEKISSEQRLRDYLAYTEEQTGAERAAGAYLPLSAIDANPISVVGESAMPLTGFGSWLDRIGVNVPQFNGVVRQGAAGLLQLLLLVGLVAATFARRRTFRAPPDQIRLSTGALAMLGVLTVLPQLSVDYGVLRAFQQGLIFFAPFVAAASVWSFRWTTTRLSVRLAFGLVLALFLDLTGVVPTVLGGYPAQLQLANSGQYYDIYYVHPEDRSAIRWLDEHTSTAEFRDAHNQLQNPYAFAKIRSLSSPSAAGDIFPTLIGTGNYVLLSYATVHKGEATVFYRGDAVTYRYPFGVLDSTKNKIYSSDGSAIYR
ncbi:DUF2206 domain-containing protein [Actinoplanes sp. NPDC026619]|uniref:DUF2206 domain-containing protein n=1 Tax=Actinoplanes sp. NPDC026619 TaxID=3155798 RepID=UPI00340584CA